MPAPVLFARYLTHRRNHYSASGNYVKYRAFLPSLEDNKTSVFHIDGLEDGEIWEIGERYVTRPFGKTLYGRGDILVAEIENTGLTLEYNNIPPRHANISGWPAPEDKDKQISLAQELAAEAKLKLCS